MFKIFFTKQHKNYLFHLKIIFYLIHILYTETSGEKHYEHYLSYPVSVHLKALLIKALHLPINFKWISVHKIFQATYIIYPQQSPGLLNYLHCIVMFYFARLLLNWNELYMNGIYKKNSQVIGIKVHACHFLEKGMSKK